MKKDYFHTSIEDRLIVLEKRAQERSLLLGEILSILSGKGRLFFLVFLTLPFCLPLQIPGLSLPFGLLIAFLGLRLSFGKHVWIPSSLFSKKLPSNIVRKLTRVSVRCIRKIKRWVHPRFEWVCYNRIMKVLNGILLCVLGLMLALPLPIPFTNLIVAWPLFILSVGMLEDDGLLVFIGYGLSLVASLFFIGMFDAINLFLKEYCA